MTVDNKDLGDVEQPLQATSTDDDKEDDIVVTESAFYSSGGMNEPETHPGDEKDVKDDENNDNPDADVSLKEMLQNWVGNTSIHGMPWMVDEGSNALWFRLIWAAFVACGFSVMVWQIEALIRDYRKFDVSTNTLTVHPEDLQFPDITICNTNAYQVSKQKALNITEPRNLEELRSLTQNVYDFIWVTEFDDEPVTNYTSVWHEQVSTFGRCWTFRTQERVRLPALDDGLLVYLNLNQSEFTADSSFAGALVFVTQQGTAINQQIPFVVAKPGRNSIVSIDNTFFERVRKVPWTRCEGHAPEHSQTKCRVQCINALVRKYCGCRRMGDEHNATTLDYCSTGELAECATSANASVLDPCLECKPACEEIRYRTTISDVDFSQVFKRNFEKDFAYLNLTTEQFTSDFVSIHINFATISYQETTESPTITFNALLAAIGGSMGLFLGISVLSLVELSDLIFMRFLPRFFGVRHLYGLGGKRTSAKKAA